MTARSGPSGWSERGGGTRCTIRSRRSGTPAPVLEETSAQSSIGIASASSTWCFTPGTSALGRSILFSAGMISRFASRARIVFATVWAWTPCAASTRSTAASHAAMERETS